VDKSKRKKLEKFQMKRIEREFEKVQANKRAIATNERFAVKLFVFQLYGRLNVHLNKI